jgi:hypothetical protein
MAVASTEWAAPDVEVRRRRLSALRPAWLQIGDGVVGFGQRRSRPMPLYRCACDGQHHPARLISRRHVAA